VYALTKATLLLNKIREDHFNPNIWDTHSFISDPDPGTDTGTVYYDQGTQNIFLFSSNFSDIGMTPFLY
jgi:hypothetical protein